MKITHFSLFITHFIYFHTQRHLVLLHGDEASEYVQPLLAVFRGKLHEAVLQGRDDGRVVVENLELSHRTGYEDALNLSVELNLFGRYYL